MWWNVTGGSLRQSRQSGILYNATTIRRLITHDTATELPKIRFSGFADIHIVTGNELIEQLASSYSEVGVDETMVVVRSNKRANIYNQGILGRVLEYEDPLTSGNRLMIVRNKYLDEKQKAPMPFIANGDIAVVRKIHHTEQLYGFQFAEVTLSFPDYDNYELQTLLLLDTLTSEAPSLTAAQHDQLFRSVAEDYADIPLKTDRMKAIREDKYFNALQVKYAYAVTCHKAQGGQWAHVYIDQGYMTDEMLNADYIHWLYTAFTRATEQLYLVNWPKTQSEEGESTEEW